MKDMVSKIAQATLEMLEAQKEYKDEKKKLIPDPVKLSKDEAWATAKTNTVDVLLSRVDVDSDDLYSVVFWFREQQLKLGKTGIIYSGQGRNRVLKVIDSIQRRNQETLL